MENFYESKTDIQLSRYSDKTHENLNTNTLSTSQFQKLNQRDLITFNGLGLAKDRINIKTEENRQSSELSLFYEEQLNILNRLRNRSNIIAIEMVTNIFLSIRSVLIN